jgi:hypothetical protein
MEIKGGHKQQRSKRFYLQRRERKVSAVMQWDLETGGPLGQVGNWVLKHFLLPDGRDFGIERCQRRSISLV